MSHQKGKGRCQVSAQPPAQKTAGLIENETLARAGHRARRDMVGTVADPTQF